MRAHKREEQPWLKYIVLPLLLILFGLIVSTLVLPKPVIAPSKYTCPETTWVNCMPGPDAPDRPQCTSEFYTWAKVNCPNFQGLAR